MRKFYVREKGSDHQSEFLAINGEGHKGAAEYLGGRLLEAGLASLPLFIEVADDHDFEESTTWEIHRSFKYRAQEIR